MEAPQYHIVVGVVGRVLDEDVLEQMLVRPQKVFRTGLKIPTSIEHDICETFPCLGFVVQEEVGGHIIHAGCRKG